MSSSSSQKLQRALFFILIVCSHLLQGIILWIILNWNDWMCVYLLLWRIGYWKFFSIYDYWLILCQEIPLSRLFCIWGYVDTLQLNASKIFALYFINFYIFVINLYAISIWYFACWKFYFGYPIFPFFRNAWF